MDADLVPYLASALDTLGDIARRPSVTDRTEENLAIVAREIELQNRWLERISLSLEAIVALLERQGPGARIN